jgi:prophage regulatory protein
MRSDQLQDHPVERLVRIDEVKTLTGLSTTSLYRKIGSNEFPRPVRLSAVARAWPLSEIQNWIAGRIEMRGGIND